MSHNVTLYDHPGPKAKRRDVIYNVVFSALFIGIIAWAGKTAYDRGIFDDRWLVLWDPEGRYTGGDVWWGLFRGVWATLKPVFISVPFVAVLATGLTVMRGARAWVLRLPARWLTEVFRGIPVLLTMLFGVLALDLEPIWAVVLGLVVYNTAVVAEILRAGIAALPSGQREAGLSIGMSPFWTLIRIQMPQAVRIMLPALVSQIVVLLKDSSLGFIIGYSELLNSIKQQTNFFGEVTKVPYVLAGATLYILLNMGVSRLAHVIEDRLGRARRSPTNLGVSPGAPMGAKPPATAGGIEGVIRTGKRTRGNPAG